MYYSKTRIVRRKVVAVERHVKADGSIVVKVPRHIPDNDALLHISVDIYNAGVRWSQIKKVLHFKKFSHRFASQYVAEHGPTGINPMTVHFEEALQPCATI